MLLREKSGNAWFGEGVRLGNVCEEDIDGSKVCCEEGVRSVFEENMGEEAELGKGLESWKGEEWELNAMLGAWLGLGEAKLRSFCPNEASPA